MLSPATRSSLVNLAAYEIGWFACVLGAANGQGSAGALLALALVGGHLLLARRPGVEWPLLLTAGVLGLVLETVHAAVGVLDFARHEPGTVAPIWVVTLWIQFATTLRFCLRWLSRRYLLAAALGFVGGPLAFVAGERLGAAAFGEPRAAMLALLGVSWSLALPLLVFLADRSKSRGLYRGSRAAGPRDSSASFVSKS